MRQPRVRVVALLALLALLAAGCAGPVANRPSAEAGARPILGVYEPGVPASWADVAHFASVTGSKPQLVVYYSGWYEKFWSGFADLAWHNSATVLVQLDPQGVDLSSIAAGGSDQYLESYARSVKAFPHTVFLSFGHEMNGDWYLWGKGHVSPAVFVAAWRHVVQVFRDVGASNVRWVWTVSSLNEAVGPLRPWWPGSSWVNFVGIDGYFYSAADTFNSVFGVMLGQLRRFSAAPVMATEVGIGPNPDRARQIEGLYADAAAAHFYGIIWFDMAQDDGLYHQDWRLEDAPAAVAAFKKAVRGCCA